MIIIIDIMTARASASVRIGGGGGTFFAAAGPIFWSKKSEAGGSPSTFLFWNEEGLERGGVLSVGSHCRELLSICCADRSRSCAFYTFVLPCSEVSFTSIHMFSRLSPTKP